ncbi:hypothetical protein ACFQZX_11965 [Mucilaginibacter litoreus]|uniref:Uncharacterized protein n=1 Tax=Mucilaginibacter litoreus TaxID=1048221 RepID=A0ABW3ATY1_9SPHI
MNCFENQADLLPDVAAERSVEMTDDEAMNKIGNDIGVALMKQKCTGFMTLAVKMAGKDNTKEERVRSTIGTFKRIENKGFNYIVLNSEGKEKSFLWFKQFSGSEAFMNSTVRLAGKKLKVTWQETEAYLPAAKGYYQVKEITAIEILQ